jgi:hypothetical protein
MSTIDGKRSPGPLCLALCARIGRTSGRRRTGCACRSRGRPGPRLAQAPRGRASGRHPVWKLDSLSRSRDSGSRSNGRTGLRPKKHSRGGTVFGVPVCWPSQGAGRASRTWLAPRSRWTSPPFAGRGSPRRRSSGAPSTKRSSTWQPRPASACARSRALSSTEGLHQRLRWALLDRRALQLPALDLGDLRLLEDHEGAGLVDVRICGRGRGSRLGRGPRRGTGIGGRGGSGRRPQLRTVALLRGVGGPPLAPSRFQRGAGSRPAVRRSTHRPARIGSVPSRGPAGLANGVA